MEYFTPEAIDPITQTIERVIEDFEFLMICKQVDGQPYGKLLDPLLEDSLAHLVDKCEELTDKFDRYIKKE